MGSTDSKTRRVLRLSWAVFTASNWTELTCTKLTQLRRVIGHARQRHEVDWLQFPAYSSQTAVQFTSSAVKQAFNRERKCVDTIGTVLVPWAGRRPFPMLQHKYIFQVKSTEAILSNCTRKLLWFEITEMMIAFKKNNLLCYLP